LKFNLVDFCKWVSQGYCIPLGVSLLPGWYRSNQIVS